MAADKLVDSTQLDADLTSVANAIRTKGGTSGSLAFPAGFVSAVGAIPTGVTPTGTKSISITQNGTTTEDVTNYASTEITVNVPTGGGEWGSRWTEVTSAIRVTKANNIAGAIFNSVLGTGQANHVSLGILIGKSKNNFPQYQLLTYERINTNSGSGNGSRYNSSVTTMNGNTSSYDAVIEIGDTFMVTDLDYSV